MEKTPKSGRELVAWLAAKPQRLVSVSGHGTRPGTFIAVVGPTSSVSIMLRPVVGGRDVELHMPPGWDATGKLTAHERHIRDLELAFTDDGFSSGFVTVKYLNDGDPFAPFQPEERP